MTCYGGEVNRAWFNYEETCTWLQREDLADSLSLSETTACLIDILREAATYHNSDPAEGIQRVALMGWSQGAATALHLATQRPPGWVLAGLMVVSGYLMTATPFQQNGDSLKTGGRSRVNGPIVFYNGAFDAIHRWFWVKPTLMRFFEAARRGGGKNSKL
jgi:pimeloyl-ACP methyl ester carboxylesterase